jgi:hydroxymethylglutaryl-CoA lyase
MIRVAELPREAFQAMHQPVPTQVKVRYLNALLKAGFDTVEVTSIVSKKIIPQLADNLEVLQNLDVTGSRSKVMVLVVNKKGAELAAGFKAVQYLSYPFSPSPAFLKMNLNSTMEASEETIDQILESCKKSGKELILYFSMAFGNPYHDPWSIGILLDWILKMYAKGIRKMMFSNVSIPVSAETVSTVFSALEGNFPEATFGLHLHTSGAGTKGILDAAYQHGCKRFDAVIHGYGGCPMTGMNLMSNLDTLELLQFTGTHSITPEPDPEALQHAIRLSKEIFDPVPSTGYRENEKAFLI